MSKQAEKDLQGIIAIKLNRFVTKKYIYLEPVITRDYAQEIIDLIVNDMISKLQAEIKA